jgi:SAM-dependent methyltransferase
VVVRCSPATVHAGLHHLSSETTVRAANLGMAHPDHIASTRDVYDFSAAHYANAVGTSVSEAFERPIDRALLDAYAEDLVGVADALVVDVGCGVGRVTSYLHQRGLNVRGIDLSPQMVATARSAHPHLSFEVALMSSLPMGDSSASAAVLWYSIIHTPPTLLTEVWTELARVLRPNALVLIGFQAGDNDVVRRENAYGSPATMTWYQHNVDDVIRSAETAGFVLHTRVWRIAELAHESTPQAFLTFRSAAS